MSLINDLVGPVEEPATSVETTTAASAPTPVDQTRRHWLAGLLAQRHIQLWSRFGRAYEQLLTTVRQRLQSLSRQQRRKVAGRIGLTLSGAALMVALAQTANQEVRANNILVADGEVAVANNDVCSLIEAIVNANDTNNGLVHDDCAAGAPNGADTITLPTGGNFALTQSFTNYLDGGTGLPVISSEVTIEGNGSTIVRDAPNNRRFRHFAVNPDGHLRLNEATLSGGNLVRDYAVGGAIASIGEITITNSTLNGNQSYSGGAIYSTYGVITIENSTISGNFASGKGGGLYIYHSRVSVNGVSITDNLSEYDGGGGLYQYRGVLYVTNSTISDNEAGEGDYGQYGGGIGMYGTEAVISSSTISNNTAYYGGGGLAAYAGTLLVVNSTISGNTVDGQVDYAGGGGLSLRTISASVVNSTVTGNGGVQFGGGLYGSEVTLTLARSLISGNEGVDGRELFVDDYNTTVTANSHNIFGFGGSGGTAGFAPGATDIVPAAALGVILEPALAANDGQTQTHALPPGSPAIDAAPNAACTAPPTGGVDQRGQLRNSNGAGGASANECDIGSYEVQGGGTGPTVTPSMTSPPPTSTPTETPFIFPTETPTGQPNATPTVTGTPPPTPEGGEGLFLPIVLDQ